MTQRRRLFLSVFMAVGVLTGIGASALSKTAVDVKADGSSSLACPAGTIVSNTMTFSTTDSNFTVLHSKGTNTNFASYSPWRIYGNTGSPDTYNTVEFYLPSGASGYTISSIVITANSATYATNMADFETTTTLARAYWKAGTSSATATDITTVVASASVVTATVPTGTLYVKFYASIQTRWNSLVINYSGTPVVPVTSINASSYKNHFLVGESFDKGNLIVKDNLNNVLAETTGYSINSAAYVSGTAGTYTIVLTYVPNSSITTSYTVTVHDPVATSSTSYDFTIDLQGWSSGSPAVETYNTVYAGFKAVSESMSISFVGSLVALDNSSGVSKVDLTISSAAYTGGELTKYKVEGLDASGISVDYTIVSPKVITSATGASFITASNASSRVISLVSLTKIVGLKISCLSYVKSGAITSISLAGSVISTSDANDLIAAKNYSKTLDSYTCGTLSGAKTTIANGYSALSASQKGIFDAMLTEDNVNTYSARYAYLYSVATDTSGTATSNLGDNASLSLILLVSIFGMTSIVGYFLLSRKKEEQA